MKIQQFRELHSRGKLLIPRSFFRNDEDSNTDPTQDVPVKNIQMMGDIPLNVKLQKQLQMSGVSIEKMTVLDKRNNDKFDALGELQGNLQATSKILQQFKKSKQNEEKID